MVRDAETTIRSKPEVDAAALQAQLAEAFLPIRTAAIQMARAAAVLADGLAKIAADLPTACSRDTNGDGNCGRRLCPECGDPRALAGLR